MLKRILIAVSLVLAFSACQNENSITGTGDHVLTGQVFAGDSPAADVTVSVPGVGTATTTDSNGRFMIVGLPGSVQLMFTRADGVNATAEVDLTMAAEVSFELEKDQVSLLKKEKSPKPQKRELEGLVTAVSATSITVNAAGKGEVTVEITSSTKIRHGSRKLTATQLKKNDRVHVKAIVNADGSLTAEEIKLQKPAPTRSVQFEGKILSISATEITIDAAGKGEVTLTINSSTKLRKGNRKLKWDELHQGDRVHIKGTEDSEGNKVAVEIKLQNPA